MILILYQGLHRVQQVSGGGGRVLPFQVSSSLRPAPQQSASGARRCSQRPARSRSAVLVPAEQHGPRGVQISVRSLPRAARADLGQIRKVDFCSESASAPQYIPPRIRSRFRLDLSVFSARKYSRRQGQQEVIVRASALLLRLLRLLLYQVKS